MWWHDGVVPYVPALRFHWLTPWYDAVVAATARERTFKEALIRQAGLARGMRVLDLGCGTGTLAVRSKQRCSETSLVGTDCDMAMLSQARHKARAALVDVRFDCAYSYALPYRSSHFDRVMSSLFFHHLTWPDKQRTAREVFRVLRPGGELHVADWGRPGNLFMRGLFLTVQIFDGFAPTRDHVAGRLPDLFEQSGFAQVVECGRFGTVYGSLALIRAVKP